MALNRRIAVIGSAISAPVTDEAKSLEELLFDVAQAAMRDAGLDADQIDGIVVASNDQFDGRAISIMAASGSVGGVDRDILSTPSAGEHAFVMGVLRVASGQYETQLVVSWSPVEASSLSEAQRLGARTGWTPHAMAYETIPLSRLTLHYFYRRNRDHSRQMSMRVHALTGNRLKIVSSSVSRLYKVFRALLSLPVGWERSLLTAVANAGSFVGFVEGAFGIASTHYRTTDGH